MTQPDPDFRPGAYPPPPPYAPAQSPAPGDAGANLAAPPPDGWYSSSPAGGSPGPNPTATGQPSGWDGGGPAAGPPAAKKRPGLALTIVGLVLLVLSLVPLAVGTAVGAVAAVEAIADAVAIPATSQWMLSQELRSGTYNIWSTSGQWPAACELVQGQPSGGKAVRLEEPLVSSEVSLGSKINLSVVRQFDSTGTAVSLRCAGAEAEGQAVLFYLVPAAMGKTIAPLVIGSAVASAMFIIGLVLVIVQTVRRASWNNRHLRQHGLI